MTKLVLTGGAVLVAALAYGCAFSAVREPTEPPHQTRIAVALEQEEAMSAIASAFEGAGFTVETRNDDLHMVRTAPLLVRTPEQCWCGTWNGGKVKGSAAARMWATVTKNENGGALVTLESSCTTDFAGANLYGATTVRQLVECRTSYDLDLAVMRVLDSVVAARKSR